MSPCETAPPPVPRLQSIALPAQITGITAVTLNPVLRFGAQSTVGAEIEVDFALPEACMEVNPGVLAEPAGFPGLPSLTLLSPLLPWAITVHASGGFVVVGDVLQAIWRELDIRITENEWVGQPARERAKQVNEKTRGPAETRNSGVSVRGLKQKRAITRLDLLGGRTKFGGLSDSTMGCEVWLLNFV
ncbi:hypothetical protein B0H19DRAFT_1129948 [Mycena capillaripes]|nr:hypothetical protein B0H19DRAFT_1129948 [Mycena capillaripes]